MNRIMESIMVLMLIATVAGCNYKPAGHDPVLQKVSEQRLATYNPLRRLTYRNACRNAGALTVCVERISQSETAALVELRITNRSDAAYQPENDSAPSLHLSSSSGSFLQGSLENPSPIPAFGEKYLYCKLDGMLSGELKAVVLEDAFSPEKIVDIVLPSS